jgi:SNF family Na+-dependent transporter
MKKLLFIFLLLFLLIVSSGSFAQGLPAGIPRDKTLILPFLFVPFLFLETGTYGLAGGHQTVDYINLLQNLFGQ